MKNGSFGAVCTLIALGLIGCASPAAKKSASADDMRDALAPTVNVTEAARMGEPSLRGGMMRSVPELQVVHFDFDSAFLAPEQRTVLVHNAEWLKKHPNTRVQVAGHCDQRGTVEYNLALGQRRAKTIRDYYVQLGVSGDRVATISYGREKPACQESTEECWQNNRRAETLAVASGLK